MSPQISVVIRAYNEAAHLGRLLDGISQQSLAPQEIILVDSGSTDNTVAMAKARGLQVVHIPPADFSFGRSLNLGIAETTSPLIVIASAHTYPVYPDWLECLARPFSDTKVAVVYGKQRGHSGSKFSEHRIFQQWFPDQEVAEQASPFCNNANAAVRRQLWVEHPYDETLTGLEDLEWAKWAQGSGKRIVYSAHAEIVHIHTETPKGVYGRYRREAMAFKRIFPESHFTIYDFLRMTAANISGDIAASLRPRLRPDVWPSILWFRVMQYWGTYLGYRHSGPLTQALRQRFYYPAGFAQQPTGKRDVPPIDYR